MPRVSLTGFYNGFHKLSMIDSVENIKLSTVSHRKSAVPKRGVSVALRKLGDLGQTEILWPSFPFLSHFSPTNPHNADIRVDSLLDE